MDHDDVILPNAFEVFVDVAEKNNVDAVTTTTWYRSSDFTCAEDMEVQQISLKSPAPVSENVKTRIWEEIVLMGIHVAPWAWLYRRKFLVDKKIKFHAEVAEDVFFTVDVLLATNKIAKIEFPFYIWRKSESSASADVSRAYKNMLSILNLSDWLEKKLSPLKDAVFTSEFIFYQVDGAIDNYLAPFFRTDEKLAMQALDEVTKAIKPRFGKNTLFVRSILHGYFQGRNAINENKFLREKLGYKN